jgi:hypothetical protein
MTRNPARSAGKTLRVVCASALATLVLALTLVVPGSTLAATPAAAASTVSAGTSTAPLAMKACAEAPEPARPSAGQTGAFYPRPATASTGDPFSDPSTTIADVYGYSYKWTTYDNGCLPGSGVVPGTMTNLANSALGWAASVNGITHSLLGLVVSPTWLDPLDEMLTEATAAIREGFFTPWFTVIAILVAAAMLFGASRANFPSVVTTGGWALLVLVGTTWVMEYPVSSAQAVDGLIQETVTTTANATGSSRGATDGANAAQRSLDGQFDTIDRQTLYTAWLEGMVGSSDSAIAREHGPDLFRATHLSWAEEATLRDDPDAGAAIIEAKKKLFEETAAEVERADEQAYQQLTGNNGRWGAMGIAILMVAVTMPFLLVAGFFVVISYAVIRMLVPLVPALGVFGMLNMTRGWVTGILSNAGRFIIMGPLFWAGALVNLMLVSAVLGTSMAFALKVALALVMPVILFKILLPKRSLPGAGMAKWFAGEALSAAINRGAVRKGVEDGMDKRDYPRTPNKPEAQPVADTPRAPGTELMPVQRPAYAGERPTFAGATFPYANPGPIVPEPPRRYGELTSAPAAQTPRTRHELARGTGTTATGAGATFLPAGQDSSQRALPPSPYVTSSDAAAASDGKAINPWLASAPVDPGATRPQHPAITPDAVDYGSSGRGTTSSPSVDEDLSAPAPQVLYPRDGTLSPDVIEAEADDDGVFQIWRPEFSESASDDEKEI